MIGGRLRSALIANLGRDLGDEAYSEALFYAWTHLPKLAEVHDLVPYLFRVGKSRVRHRLDEEARLPIGDFDAVPDVEPRLIELLRELSPRQRTAVVLVVGWGWSHREVAEMLGISKSSVQVHAERALAHLRTELGIDEDDD